VDSIDPTVIIAALTGEAAEDQLRELSLWRARSAENEHEYRRLARLWLAAGEAETVPARVAHPPAFETIIDRAGRRGERALPFSSASSAPATRSRGPGRRVSTKWLWAGSGVAATLVLGFSVSLWTRYERSAPFGPESLVTGANEVATVTLQDETVVRLAPGSRLTFFRDENTREVSLTGRAYFAVAKDPSRPFRVRLPHGEIEVLGTRFDVESRNADVQVAVVEGAVRVEAHGARLDLEAKQVARVPGVGSPDVRRVEDPYEVIGWLGGFLAFESTPMEQVAEEFSRRFDLRLDIADDALRGRTLTGWFADQTPREMLAGICTVLEARCDLERDVVRMTLAAPAQVAAGDSR
jgi:transmembrane sensor